MIQVLVLRGGINQIRSTVKLTKQAEAAAKKAIEDALAAGKGGCFAAGTPLLTPHGSRFVEDFEVGDLILSRDEYDPSGPVVGKLVEAIFVRSALVWELRINGHVVRTTGEHPFYAWEKGWVNACELKRGDTLLTLEQGWVTVEEVMDTGKFETVYNLRVADFHTYFVGCDEWGFSVWAHNTCEHAVEYLKSIGITNQAAIDEVIQAARLSDPTGIRVALNRAKGGNASFDELTKISDMVRSEFKLTAPIDYTGHILTAEVKANGNVVGGHSTATGQVKVVPGSASAPNPQGCTPPESKLKTRIFLDNFCPKQITEACHHCSQIHGLQPVSKRKLTLLSKTER